MHGRHEDWGLRAEVANQRSELAQSRIEVGEFRCELT